MVSEKTSFVNMLLVQCGDRPYALPDVHCTANNVKAWKSGLVGKTSGQFYPGQLGKTWVKLGKR